MSLEEPTHPNPPVLWSFKAGPVVVVEGEYLPACRSEPCDLGRVQRITAAQAVRWAALLEDPILQGAALNYIAELLEPAQEIEGY